MAHGKIKDSATGAQLGHGHPAPGQQSDKTMELELMEEQIKSKQRVAARGEVFTGKREVNAMLDLVKDETENIDSRFLEQACGTGNFVTEILERKLRVVKKRYAKSQLEYERYAVKAVSSIYGIDILEDNVQECRNRLFEIFDKQYTNVFKAKTKEKCRAAVRFILVRNIIWGDALSLRTLDQNPQPIVFSEWTFSFHDSRIKRRDFEFSELMPDDLPTSDTQDLFSKSQLVSDLGNRAFIPKEVHVEPPVNFLKIGEGHE